MFPIALYSNSRSVPKLIIHEFSLALLEYANLAIPRTTRLFFTKIPRVLFDQDNQHISEFLFFISSLYVSLVTSAFNFIKWQLTKVLVLNSFTKMQTLVAKYNASWKFQILSFAVLEFSVENIFEVIFKIYNPRVWWFALVYKAPEVCISEHSILHSSGVSLKMQGNEGVTKNRSLGWRPCFSRSIKYPSS